MVSESFKIDGEVVTRGNEYTNEVIFAGVTDKLSDAISATLEYQALRDRDPEGHETRELAGVSLAWQSGPRFQVDLGSNFGLDHAAPDVELYVGISRKF